MEPKPLVNALPAASGKKGCVGPKKRGRSPPSIDLGLGVGGGTTRVKSTFTPAQLCELHQQRLVFKHMVAGFPLPFQMIHPIWNRFAWSFAPPNYGFYYPYPSSIGFSPNGFDYRSLMDPEPGRCRRTDGKKWRCSRDVVHNQKHCERHMHRGCRRSRKHVEASTTTTTTTATTTSTCVGGIDGSDGNDAAKKATTATTYGGNNKSNNHAYPNKDNTTTTTTTTTSTTCVGIDGSDDNDAAKIASTAATYGGNNESNNHVYSNKDTTTTTTTTTTNTKTSDAAGDNSNSKSTTDLNDGKHASYNLHSKRIKIKGSSNKLNNCKVDSFVAPGIGFSAETVLQAPSTTRLSGISGSDNNAVAKKNSNAATYNGNTKGNNNVHRNTTTATTTTSRASVVAGNRSNNGRIDGKDASCSHLNNSHRKQKQCERSQCW